MNLIGYKLECDHPVNGPATLVNGLLRCPWHQCEFKIVDVLTIEWRAKCHGCRYARWAGQSEATANLFADGHNRRNAGHTLTVTYEENPEAKKTKARFDAWHMGTEQRETLSA